MTKPRAAAAPFGDAPTIVALSCAAKQHGIVIVANLGDLIYCTRQRESPANRGHWFLSTRDDRLNHSTHGPRSRAWSGSACSYRVLWGEPITAVWRVALQP